MQLGALGEERPLSNSVTISLADCSVVWSLIAHSVQQSSQQKSGVFGDSVEDMASQWKQTLTAGRHTFTAVRQTFTAGKQTLIAGCHTSTAGRHTFTAGKQTSTSWQPYLYSWQTGAGYTTGASCRALERRGRRQRPTPRPPPLPPPAGSKLPSSPTLWRAAGVPHCLVLGFSALLLTPTPPAPAPAPGSGSEGAERGAQAPQQRAPLWRMPGVPRAVLLAPGPRGPGARVRGRFARPRKLPRAPVAKGKLPRPPIALPAQGGPQDHCLPGAAARRGASPFHGAPCNLPGGCSH